MPQIFRLEFHLGGVINIIAKSTSSVSTQQRVGEQQRRAGQIAVISMRNALFVHCSGAGNGMWKPLESRLSNFRCVAPNLIGYGGSPAWPATRPQTLDDQADHVATSLPDAELVTVVGHSFGGSIAMKIATRLGSRVDNLVLYEPNPFYLLGPHSLAFSELQKKQSLANASKGGDHEALQRFSAAFCDYWNGSGTWHAFSEKRRAKFVSAILPNVHEWDAVMDTSETTLDEWAAALPQCRTLHITSEDTVDSIREVSELLEERFKDRWTFARLPAGNGGHMAPVTNPAAVFDLIAEFIEHGEGTN